MRQHSHKISLSQFSHKNAIKQFMHICLVKRINKPLREDQETEKHLVKSCKSIFLYDIFDILK